MAVVRLPLTGCTSGQGGVLDGWRVGWARPDEGEGARGGVGGARESGRGQVFFWVLRRRTLLAHLSICLTPCRTRAATGEHLGGLSLLPPLSDVWCERPSRALRVPCAPTGASRAPRFDASCAATQLL